VSHIVGILAKYEALFEKGYGYIQRLKASFQVWEGAQPIVMKVRPLPCDLKEKVEQELQRLEKEGVIYNVSQMTGLPEWRWSLRKMIHWECVANTSW